jgi:tryptophan halogenase
LQAKKKILIIGAGTAGAIAASLIKKCYGDYVDVTVVYDKANESIGVGEGTFPDINGFLETTGITESDLIKNVDATIKLGLNFKNWLPGSSYFHGFLFSSIEKSLYRINLPNETSTSPVFYEIANGIEQNSFPYFQQPTVTVPKVLTQENHAYHIDGVKFSKYIRERFKNSIFFIESKITKINHDEEKIKSIEIENGKRLTADFYIDCSGFAKILIKNFCSLDWVDISDVLPLDRAITQQVKANQIKEMPSYTLCEATTDGWIWQIPVGRRYGLGYLYSSKFTTDQEAKTNFNVWLKDNHDVELTTENIIHYKSGYYKKFCAGNWAAVGLSSGFIEPLEATGITLILRQIKLLLKHDVLISNTEEDKNKVSEKNRLMYEQLTNFIDLHYCTNRTDSKFWTYKTTTKTWSLKYLEEKCKTGMLTTNIIESDNFFPLESYIAIASGLSLFDDCKVKDSFNQFENKKSEIFLESKRKCSLLKSLKVQAEKENFSHKHYIQYNQLSNLE